MAHTREEKKKLLNRVRRIRGQVDIERALGQGPNVPACCTHPQAEAADDLIHTLRAYLK